MLKLKKTSVKLQRASFSRIGILGVCFLVFIFINSCGFHLAEKKSWIGQAKSLRMEKIENHSRILGIDFLLKKELDFRILQHPELDYTKNLADLNLNIKITQADFSSIFQKQSNSDYYTHSQTLKVEILLQDLRNLAPSQKKLTFIKDVALDIDMHESTVSRISNRKYMHTPRGIFELKYFFSSGVEQKDGAVISSLKIKEHIQKIISQENTKKPYTDSYMAEKLCELENIKVARRTIAKYRESLGIPSSNRRKRD